MFASIPILVCLLAAESAVRVYDWTQGRSPRARTSWYWLYERDPFLGYRGVPGARVSTGVDDLVHSPDGFRDRRSLEDISGLDGRHLVICIGESSTYGILAGDVSGTYPYQLEDELRRLSGDSRWVVMNAGMPGYTSHEAVVLLSLRLAKLRPSVVVAMNLRNDYVFAGHYLSETIDYDELPLKLAQRGSWWAAACATSSACGLVLTRALPWMGDDLGGRTPAPAEHPPTPRSREQYRTNLGLLAALSEMSGFKLMLVDQPVNTSKYSAVDRTGLGVLRSDLRDVAATRNVQILEADAGFPWSVVGEDEDVHLGRAGYGVLAGRLAPQILEACPSGRCS